ncbi:hypothetical protein Cni_G15122 [Canna indica]|uniref:WPP domain-interacting protein 2 n=1 Tax=Canna indica TaxID=4628 RepID=A0AAQ3QEL1_9LILI|nr:hypothetical protein Cni_G15122 [Canna indica]
MNLVETSKLRSDELGEENGSETSEKMAPSGEIKVEFDEDLGRKEPYGMGSPIVTGVSDRFREEVGSVSPAEAALFSPESVKANGEPIEGEFLVESPSNLIGSSSSTAATNSAPTKGYGLKKWRRRIRRDLSKDVTSNADSAQILKRRLSIAEPSKAHDDNKHKSDGNVEDDGECEGEEEGEGSVASLVSMNVGSTPLVVAPTTLDPELGLLVTDTGFNIGVDSENSDDHSSKSSTAASAPRRRSDTVGFGRDSSRIKNLGGRGSGHVVQQRGQWARGRTDVGKKLRENQVKNEIENSYSSVESDLRSSNMAALHMGSMASNGKQSENSVNCDAEQSDDGHPSQEVRSNFYKENGTVGELTRKDLDTNQSGEENSSRKENNRPMQDLDPFLESIDSLQAAKEALENEIQNFREISTNILVDDCDGLDGQYQETEGISSLTVEANLVELVQKIEHLECKLEEALNDVKTKESKVLELEAILDRTGKEVDNTDVSLLEEKCHKMEIELENLLQKKIETEIEYMIMMRTTQSWKVLTEDHIALLEEQKSLCRDQSEVMLKVKNAENRAILLKQRAEELEKDLLETREVLRLQRKTLKYSLCCFFQMVVLFIAFGLFLLHLAPSSTDIAPT